MLGKWFTSITNKQGIRLLCQNNHRPLKAVGKSQTSILICRHPSYLQHQETTIQEHFQKTSWRKASSQMGAKCKANEWQQGTGRRYPPISVSSTSWKRLADSMATRKRSIRASSRWFKISTRNSLLEMCRSRPPETNSSWVHLGSNLERFKLRRDSRTCSCKQAERHVHESSEVTQRLQGSYAQPPMDRNWCL